MKVGQAPPTFTALLRACLSVNTAVKQPSPLTLRSLKCTSLDMDLPSSFFLILCFFSSFFFLFTSSLFFPLPSFFLLPLLCSLSLPSFFFLLVSSFLFFLHSFFLLPLISSLLLLLCLLPASSFLFLLLLSSSFLLLFLPFYFFALHSLKCTTSVHLRECSVKGKGCLIAPKTLKTWRTLKRMLIILGS